MTDIRGKTAVVTGGGSGIGKGLALVLAEEGAAVAIADIIPDNARAVADEINAAGGKALGVACDVCERASVKRMKAEVNATLGPVSLLFANAGATNFEPLAEMADNEVDWIIQVNLMGVIHCLQAFLPDMVAARDGHVVGTSSIAGLMPPYIAVHSPYSAAKMGIIGMMMNLRRELEEYNVGSTVYCPGGVTTGMKENNARYRPERFGGPTVGDVTFPDISFANVKTEPLAPTHVARMVMRAVRDNRAVVLDHSNQRSVFQQHYVDHVMQAYDDAEAFERDVVAGERAAS